MVGARVGLGVGTRVGGAVVPGVNVGALKGGECFRKRMIFTSWYTTQEEDYNMVKS